MNLKYNDEEDPMKYMYSRNIPREGQTVEICHNPFSSFQEYGSEIMKLGQLAVVLKTGKFMKSRPEGLDLYYCIVKFKDSSIGMYHTSNFKIK